MRLSNEDVLLHWPLAQHIITVETPNNPRALPAQELAAAVAKGNPSAWLRCAGSRPFQGPARRHARRQVHR